MDKLCTFVLYLRSTATFSQESGISFGVGSISCRTLCFPSQQKATTTEVSAAGAGGGGGHVLG